MKTHTEGHINISVLVEAVECVHVTMHPIAEVNLPINSLPQRCVRLDILNWPRKQVSVLKMNTVLHSPQYCTNNWCSALNEMLYQYYIQFGRSSGANHVGVVRDTINIQLFW